MRTLYCTCVFSTNLALPKSFSLHLTIFYWVLFNLMHFFLRNCTFRSKKKGVHMYRYWPLLVIDTIYWILLCLWMTFASFVQYFAYLIRTAFFWSKICPFPPNAHFEQYWAFLSHLCIFIIAWIWSKMRILFHLH